ncbi:anhydro-N-acetylmuramic acid kinase [Thiosulfativibrio zosterae]|uniref:Anhydro-N-acetylmuramic acid kinase n=1 Tax=Thiosulfativibrio zosterae TaxID=2675053 RepID=A0A6F8PQ53_9GAMM|nr:anhydro-N-acetylmuramic acid kinase [Thiosulfativibrio zosterae]BBP44239.1 anhydro-N-acetylmuramic acid kinase [Thiosulfativibrio zosterae]
MNKLAIGLMSGTSLDGIDAALVSYSESDFKLVDFITHPMSVALRQQLLELNQSPSIGLKTLCQLEKAVADAFSAAAQTLLTRNQLKPQHIEILGSHGQTIFHAPEIPMSLQIGHAAFIAKQTGICTAADFRVDDMANLGQGAPLAPAFHQFLFQKSQPIALVNIGGIANISFIDSQGDVSGFDTGPGNGLMDEICQTQLGQSCDFNGDIAASHPVDSCLLEQLLQHTYFKQTPPKSTGRDIFNQDWLAPLLKLRPNLSTETLISTLNQLTVDSIVLGLNALPSKPKSLLVCGGGALNKTLLQRLQQQLPYPVNTTESQAINPHAIEAMMCAWLGIQRLNHQPIALKSITGAQQNSILGGLWLP